MDPRPVYYYLVGLQLMGPNFYVFLWIQTASRGCGWEPNVHISMSKAPWPLGFKMQAIIKNNEWSHFLQELSCVPREKTTPIRIVGHCNKA